MVFCLVRMGGTGKHRPTSLPLSHGGSAHAFGASGADFFPAPCLGKAWFRRAGRPSHHQRGTASPYQGRLDPRDLFGGRELVGSCIRAPGHASFTTDADDTDWIVYHSARHPGSGWDRQVRVQPFVWEGVFPIFGAPGVPPPGSVS
ncbi:MAG: hypothetical protein EBV49_15590 [Betaproteobacteria bacterium]|nr:hypothetical protein [Betaproteobacteria bacterium]